MRYSIDKYNLRFNNTGVDQLIMTENGFGNLNVFHCLLHVFTGRSYMYPEIPIHREYIYAFLVEIFFPDCISSSANDMYSMAFAL